MGYLTSIICFGVWNINRPSGKRTPEDYEQESDIISEIDSETSNEINNLHDDNDPIKEISLRHEDYVIEIEGRGGDQEDLWRRRYLNGKYEQIAPEWPSYKTIVPHEETLLTSSDADTELTEKINELLEQKGATERIILKDGRFFVNHNIEDGDNIDEVNRAWVETTLNTLK